MSEASRSILARSLSDEVLYSRPADHLKIFLSSRIRGGPLAAERRTAIGAIEASPFHRAWAWERDANAGPYSASAVCVAHARTSDALVLILAEDLTAMTRREYNAAKTAGVPRFVLLKDGVTQSAEVIRFVRRERRGLITANFQNEAELITQIQNALRAYALRAHRLSISEKKRIR